MKFVTRHRLALNLEETGGRERLTNDGRAIVREALAKLDKGNGVELDRDLVRDTAQSCELLRRGAGQVRVQDIASDPSISIGRVCFGDGDERALGLLLGFGGALLGTHDGVGNSITSGHCRCRRWMNCLRDHRLPMKSEEFEVRRFWKSAKGKESDYLCRMPVVLYDVCGVCHSEADMEGAAASLLPETRIDSGAMTA